MNDRKCPSCGNLSFNVATNRCQHCFFFYDENECYEKGTMEEQARKYKKKILKELNNGNND